MDGIVDDSAGGKLSTNREGRWAMTVAQTSTEDLEGGSTDLEEEAWRAVVVDVTDVPWGQIWARNIVSVDRRLNWRCTRNEGPGAAGFCAESRSSTRSSLYWMKIGSRKVN
jgi:hypothetical protein